MKKLSYKEFRLPNKLRTILVHTDEVDPALSAVGLAVGAGSFDEPPDLNGLCHLKEHTVFDGSAPYPGRYDYELFVNTHGGSSNGQTLFNLTTFQSVVETGMLEECMERLGSLMLNPLLRDEDVRHEIEMLESELTLKRRDPGLIMDQLLTLMAKPESPLGRFSWGNKESLHMLPAINGINVVEAVRKSHRKHYQPTQMTLAVVSDRSLQDLEQLVNKYFGVKSEQNNDEESGIEREQPAIQIVPEKFHRRYKIAASNDSHTLYLLWAITPNLQTATKPLELISYVLNCWGRGSLLTQLMRQNLATAITFRDKNPEVACAGMTFVKVSIVLTPNGSCNILSVLRLFYQAILGMKQLTALQAQRLFDDKKILDDRLIQIDLMNYVEELTSYMHIASGSEYISGRGFSYKELQSYITLLSPDHMSLTHMAPGISTTMEEKWFRFKYSVEEIPQEWIDELSRVSINSQLMLPEAIQSVSRSRIIKFKPNQIAATHIFRGKYGKDRYPYQLYHHTDPNYDTTSAHLNICLHHPDMGTTTDKVVMVEIYTRILELKLKEDIYQGVMMNIQTLISFDYNGILLQFAGDSAPLVRYVRNLVSVISDMTLDDGIYSIAKNAVEIEYGNILSEPSSLASTRLEELIFEGRFKKDELLKILPQINLSNLNAYLKQIQNKGTAFLMIHGNISETTAVRFADKLSQTLQIYPTSLNDITLPTLPRRDSIKQFDLENINEVHTEQNHCPGDEATIVSNLYISVKEGNGKQSEEKFLIEKAHILILTNILETYHEFYLRSEYALCYSADLEFYEKTPDIAGISCIVYGEATRFSENRIDHYMDGFLLEVRRTIIMPMTEETYKEYRQAVSQAYGRDEEEEAVFRWNQIVRGSFNFKQRKALSRAIKKSSLKAFKSWSIRFMKETLDGRITGNKLSVKIIGDSRGGVYRADNGDVDDDDDDDDVNKRFEFFNDGLPNPPMVGRILIRELSREISEADYQEKYTVLWFFESIFSPSCQYQLKRFNEKIENFWKREALVIACSTNHVNSFIASIREICGEDVLKVPLLSDSRHKTSLSYGVFQERSMSACSALFLIDRAGVIRYARREIRSDEVVADVALKLLIQLKRRDVEEAAGGNQA